MDKKPIPPETIEQMAELAVRGRLVKNDDMRLILGVFRNIYSSPLNSPDALSAFSAHLVSIGLTQWQCDKLRIGKWKGFFLDDYELIDFAGTEDDRRIYLARRSRPGPIVRLAVICQK